MKELPKALYRAPLKIGNVELQCAVLDDETRVLTLTSVFKVLGRPKKGKSNSVTDLPAFMDANNLEPFVNQGLREVTKKIDYMDGNSLQSGYNALILPRVCQLYLDARRSGKLYPSQLKTAMQAEILVSAFADIGIVALIDEATGYQVGRKYDALRVLLNTYLADKIKQWIKEFPDDFFLELDRLYGNINLKSNQRPSYYGTFINTYVYEPIEKGRLNPELQKRYMEDNKRHRKHQHFTDFGTGQLRIQIGKILGLMQVAPNLKWFKQKQERQGQLSLFPEVD